MYQSRPAHGAPATNRRPAMGTRSLTIVLDDNQELCRIYRQYDGYPSGHGLDLAKLCNVTLVNGYNHDQKAGKFANGIGCLAAQIIAGLKDGIGNVYLETTGGEISDAVEYVYTVRGDAGGEVTIECRTNAGNGAIPFNWKTDSEHLFSGNAKQFIAKFKPRNQVGKKRAAAPLYTVASD
jgi:hypothetical protein